ncbi:MAG: hypothetical protein GX431_13225 [Bacteroidales bacterium]|jgi:hypothetical protein|nr:hypothetical protein [Bacteroidales bacterium]
MKIRITVFLTTCILLISSCSRFQYASVNSYLPKNDSGEYIVENDTVAIRYSFAGQNLSLSLNIFNKLRQPVYLDQERSLIVLNDEQINGSFYGDDQVSFIAPLSNARITSIPLRDELFEINRKDSTLQKTRIVNEGISYSYDINTTPLYFRVILAISPNENYSMPTFFDYSFWVSDILQSTAGPKTISAKPSNMFYLKKSTGFGNAIFWTAIITLLLIGGALGE